MHVRRTPVPPLDGPDHAQTMGQTAQKRRTHWTQLDLPPREVANALIDTFFAKVHCDFPVFHRALFQEAYDDTWEVATQDTDPAWLMALYMVFVLALQAPSDNPLHAQFAARKEGTIERYVAKAKMLLPEVIVGCTLAHVQALMVYCLHLHLSKERNACWNIMGSAIRIAIAIGLHSNGTYGKCSPLLHQVRKRVWWTLYAFERIECSSLGRPSAVDDSELSVSVPTEGLLDMGNIFPLNHLDAQSQLMMILGRICKARIGTEDLSPAAVEFADDILHQLDSWIDKIPFHLRWNPDFPRSHHRAILLLHIQYHYTRMLLTRPFLAAWTREKSASPPTDFTARCGRTCVESAKASAQLLQKLADGDLFNSKTWWDVYFVEATSVALILGKLVGAPEFDADADALTDSLHICMSILRDCNEFSPTMQRFAKVASTFMQQLMNNEPGAKEDLPLDRGARVDKAAEDVPSPLNPGAQPNHQSDSPASSQVDGEVTIADRNYGHTEWEWDAWRDPWEPGDVVTQYNMDEWGGLQAVEPDMGI
ncbi:Fungal specific transcription factor domain-containing protein [Cladophialophora immunda]|nr:Fungal specific transcription factor domain-containing protein [Cladophialophora immunda]